MAGTSRCGSVHGQKSIKPLILRSGLSLSRQGPTLRRFFNPISFGAVKQVYKITYPTGKIYIGKDSVGSARYMGSPSMDLVNVDFAKLPTEMQRDYWLRKEILWESADATETELSAKEVELIRQYRSNDPEVGYNRWQRACRIE